MMQLTSLCILQRKLNPNSPGGGADLPPTRVNAYIRKKSMGVNSDNFCVFLNVC